MSLGNTYIQVYIFEFQVYNDIALSYAGLAKLGGRPGQSAHFAATVKLQVCQENMTLCHFEGCWTFQPRTFELFNPGLFKPRLINHELFNHELFQP